MAALNSAALHEPHVQNDSLAMLATAIVLVDADGSVAYLNCSAQELFGAGAKAGQSVPEILGQAEQFGLIVPGSADKIGAAIATSVQQGTCRFETTDGRVFVGRCRYYGGGTAFEFTDISEQVLSARISDRDPLTGLVNRMAFRVMLGDALREIERDGGALAILAIDLDRFKGVNDTLGHPIGDALLRTVADRIRRLAGEEGTLARLGGDEFALLRKVGEPSAAEALAARIVDVVGRPYLLKGHMINVGASVGIAMAPADGVDPEDLIKRSDLALFRAKEEGRGTFRFFESKMDAQMQARRLLEVKMRRALALREFSLAYQPQFDVKRNRLVGFEALLRWTHEGNSVSPAQFVPLAEEIGLIIPLGEWVLRTACREAAKWPSEIGISVNLSPMQFRLGSKLLSTVTSALAAAGVAPSRLELEITEGALLDNTEGVVGVLRQLKSLGIKISMDDFGTGYSSLSYLQKFPLRQDKIDQSFVRNMVDNPDSEAIVRAVTALGQSLGMTTIAEGVETEEQLGRVRDQGCEVVQGYLTGRPMAADAATTLATSRTSTV